MSSPSSSSSELTLVRIASSSGRVDVVAEQRSDVQVQGEAEVTRSGTTTTINSSSGRLRIRVPTGIDLVVGTSSGGVSVAGALGQLSIVTESGKVVVDQALSVDARSASGRIDIAHCSGDCRVRSESGTVSVASCEQASVATDTGKIRLRDVRGSVRAHCTSGRIDIEMAGAHDIDAETVTGRIAVSLPRGVRASRSDVFSDESVPDDADCKVIARSVSGRIKVKNR